MANIKQEYLAETQKALLMRQINSDAQRRRLVNLNYGVQTPIDAKALDDVPRGKVVLSQEVFKQLQIINDESEKAGAEFAYILTGITEGQTVKFDNIVWCRNKGNAMEADFTPLIPKLKSYIDAVKATGEKQAVVCNGHTHPKSMSAYAKDFSIYDMAGFMQMKEENSVFKKGDISLCGGIMSDLNFNFCFYDNQMQNFYKFNDVVLQLETGEQIPLSCYDRQVSRTQIENAMQNNQRNAFRETLRVNIAPLSPQAQNRQRLMNELNRGTINHNDRFDGR
jgi:hypothetical protein